MMNKIKLLSLISFIKTSNYRSKIFEALHEYEVLTPTKISEHCSIAAGNVSNILKDLSEKELIICINPEMRKGKLYCLTETGETVYEHINNIDI